MATSGRNVHMILETNGIRELTYYKQLLQPISPYRLCVRFSVHLPCINMEQILSLTALVLQEQQFCSVFVNYVPEYDAKAYSVYHKLIQFHEKIEDMPSVFPFALCITFPTGERAPWLPISQGNIQAFEPAFPSWTVVPETHDCEIHFLDEENTLPTDAVYCVGVHSVQVETDGTCSLGRIDGDSPFAPALVHEARLREDLPVPMRFMSLDEGKLWLSAFTQRAFAYEINGGPVRSPFGCEMSLEQKIRVRLKRLKPLTHSQDTQEGCHSLWQSRKDEIFTLYEHLSDNESKTVFLRKLKAELLGDTAYLAPSKYDLFAHPLLSDIPYEDGGQGRLRCQTLTQGDLKHVCAQIAWYRPAIEIILPSTHEWFDILATLTNTCTHYDIFLGQHGMKTALYGKPISQNNASLIAPPMRVRKGPPLLSLICKVTRDDETLLQTSTSVIELSSVLCCELIVLTDASIPKERVDELARTVPWLVRTYHTHEKVSLTQAYNEGLAVSQGEYVCFLRLGDTLNKDVLTQVARILEQEKNDLIICNKNAQKTVRIDGRNALKGFFSGTLGVPGTTNKIYRAALFRDFHISFSSLAQDMEDSVINVPIMYFSRTVRLFNADLVVQHDHASTLPSDEERFSAFIKGLEKLATFCQAHDVPIERDDIQSYVLRTFKDEESAVVNLLLEADAKDALESLLSDNVIRIMQNFQCLETYLFAQCIERATPGLEENHIHREQQRREPIYHVYEAASIDYEHTPALSCVIIVGEGDGVDCVQAFLDSMTDDLECVLIDNQGDADRETGEILKDYAELYPSVHLVQVDTGMCEHDCVAIGIRESHARAVTFMHGSDLPSRAFFENALQCLPSKISANGSIFSLEGDHRSTRDLSLLTEEVISGEDALNTFLQKNYVFDHTGIVFDRIFLQEIFEKTEPFFISDEEELLRNFLKNSTDIYFSKNGKIQIFQTKNRKLTITNLNITESFYKEISFIENIKKGRNLTKESFNYLHKNFTEKYIKLYNEFKEPNYIHIDNPSLFLYRFLLNEYAKNIGERAYGIS